MARSKDVMAGPGGPAPDSAPRPVRFPVAPPDSQVLIITGLFIVSLLFFGGQLVLSILRGTRIEPGDYLVTLVVAGMLLWRWLSSVRGYVLAPEGADGPLLLVQRVAPWGTVPLALGRVREVAVSPALRPIGNTNILALGSLFGWAGPAVSPELGPVIAFATNRSRTVVLHLNPRPDQVGKSSGDAPPRGPIVLLSPRDPQAFLAAVQPYCGGQ